MTNAMEPCTGRISAPIDGMVTAAADCCDRLPLFCPSGIRSCPKEGELGLLLPLGGWSPGNWRWKAAAAPASC